MDFPQRIELENVIFAYADKLHVQIHALNGRLVTSARDCCLTTLLGVYNAFFYRENLKNFCAQESVLEGNAGFEISVVRTPLLSIKDYKFELIMGRKNA